ENHRSARREAGYGPDADVAEQRPRVARDAAVPRVGRLAPRVEVVAADARGDDRAEPAARRRVHELGESELLAHERRASRSAKLGAEPGARERDARRDAVGSSEGSAHD